MYCLCLLEKLHLRRSIESAHLMIDLYSDHYRHHHRLNYSTKKIHHQMSASNDEFLYQAAKRGDLVKVKELLSKGTGTKYRDEVSYICYELSRNIYSREKLSCVYSGSSLTRLSIYLSSYHLIHTYHIFMYLSIQY